MSAITGRYTFYNGSAFGEAIATDKTALLPGETAAFTNYTSYSGGITGIFIDFDAIPGTLTAADFDFYVSADGETWTPVIDPTVSQSDNRVKCIWAAGTITNKWLRVTVLATENTGLSNPDVHYWGNLVAEVTGDFVVAAIHPGDADLEAIIANVDFVDTNKPITSLYDINRDKAILYDDFLLASENNGATLVQLVVPMLTKIHFALSGTVKVFFTQQA
jgi:hypothetical protein